MAVESKMTEWFVMWNMVTGLRLGESTSYDTILGTIRKGCEVHGPDLWRNVALIHYAQEGNGKPIVTKSIKLVTEIE